MALNGMGLGLIFSARDLASGIFDRIAARFAALDSTVTDGSGRIGRALKGLAVGGALFGAGALGLKAAFSLVEPAGDFEQAIAAVGAVANATGADLELLSEAALKAGRDTQFSPIEAAAGLQELAAAGFNARESADLLIPTLDLAAGSLGKLTVEGAAGLASQAIKAFGLDSADAGVAVDQMLQAVNTFALSADELPMALGIASRGAAAAKQSFSDTITAIGLVKNVVPGVERGATAVAVAMERLARVDTQQALRGIGVSVLEADGSFRSLLDILGDAAPALDKMSDSKRAKFLIDTFGEHALGGINAILTQMTTGVRGANGEILKGAAALDYLRGQMKNSEGAAASFRDKMLDTFNGQKTLLKGSISTLAIVIGQPLIEVLKPIVRWIIEGVNRLVEAIQRMPAPLKRVFAQLLVGGSIAFMVIGTLFALKAAFFLVGLAAHLMGGAVLGALLPLLPMVALVAAGVALLYVNMRNDGEGFRAWLARMWSKVGLIFEGLTQVFRDGGFSGAVREELNRAENAGLKNFVIGVFMFAHRLEAIWAGIRSGFETVWQSLVIPILGEVEQSLRSLWDSIGRLGAQFRKTFGGATEQMTGFMPASQSFKEGGEVVGGALGMMVAGVIKLFDWFVKLIDLIAKVAEKLTWIFDKVGTFLGEFAGEIYLTTQGESTLTNAVKLHIEKVKDQQEQDAGIRPIQSFNGLFPRVDFARFDNQSRAAEPMPAAAQAEVLSSSPDQVSAAAMDSLLVGQAAILAALRNPPPTIIQVDGEAIARASAAGGASAAGRSFTPVPVYQ